MGLLDWISQNWFSLLQSAGIIGGLLFTGLTLRATHQERRNSNVLAITQGHRELWANFYKRPSLARVLDLTADLTRCPVTREEEMFVQQLIVHLHSSLEVLNPAMRVQADEALCNDIRWFFSLPVPKSVWDQVKIRQDSGFVRFVEGCRT